MGAEHGWRAAGLRGVVGFPVGGWEETRQLQVEARKDGRVGCSCRPSGDVRSPGH